MVANVEAAATPLDAGTLAALAEAVSGGEIAGGRTSSPGRADVSAGRRRRAVGTRQ
jgi:hypothetical protein